MNSIQRREEILSLLRRADRPLSATWLAGQLSVSRQIIVGDVALLRASGEEITATSRGYVLGQVSGGRRRVACCHRAEDMRRELELMVDYGCTVEDVIVEHSVYGQLTGQLNLSSRYDVEEFVRTVEEREAKALSDLTDGIHLHTLRYTDGQAFERLLEELGRAGLLVEE